MRNGNLRVLCWVVVALSWLVCVEGSSGADLVVNGDFENTSGWGALNSDNYPPGWQKTQSFFNPAAQQSGDHAIGGDGTSAFLPAQVAYGRMVQNFSRPSPTQWQYDMDFAAEDPGYGPYVPALSMRLSHVDEFAGYICLYLVDADNDGVGDLHFWHDPLPGLQDCVIFDNDVETEPLVHHLRIIGHYDAEEPSYDIIVTDSDGQTKSSSGVKSWQGGSAPVTGDGMTTIFFNAVSTGGDYLIDNLYLGEVVPDKTPGDANLDGKVTDADAAILATNWQQCDVDWGEGDFNDDGCVTDADAAILATHWQEGVESHAVPVPEPFMAVLFGSALSSLLIWRRRA